MAIYAIGDIQGCYDDLIRLLELIRFKPGSDQVWFTGDLVNRGPKSLETLRFVKSLGDSAITVLGNHDLHLLATAYQIRQPHKKDTLDQILKAKDCDELLTWLRQQPLLYSNDEYNLLHAGLPPQWDYVLSKKMAAKAENILRGPDYMDFFKVMYGDKPDLWTAELKGMDKIRFIVNCFTRIRYCYSDGQLEFKTNSAPGTQNANLLPWFAVPNRKSKSMKIIFGHWSTLGFYQSDNCYGLDTGCLWGGELTAIRLGKKIKRYSLACKPKMQPSP